MKTFDKLMLIIFIAGIVLGFFAFVTGEAEAGPFSDLGPDTRYVLVTYSINRPLDKQHQIAVPLVWQGTANRYTFLYNTFLKHVAEAHAVKNRRNIIINEIFPYSGYYFADE